MRTINDMIKRFDLVTSLSDHTLGNATAINSMDISASIIEKSITMAANQVNREM